MRRGRPRKPPSQRRSRLLHHRLTLEEYRKVSAAAKRAGLSLSEYARKKLLEPSHWKALTITTKRGAP